jgi:hypothetical protein
MGWIEDTLRDLARRRSALAAPPPGENGPQPTGPIGQPTGGGLGAAVMGPQPSGETGFHPGPRGAVDRSRALGLGAESPERTMALVQAYQTYLRKADRKQDPLMDRVRSRPNPDGPGTLVDEQRPAQLLPGEDGPLRVNTSGNKRRGLSFQQFQVPGRGRVNVYYTPDGRRIVVPLPRKK